MLRMRLSSCGSMAAACCKYPNIRAIVATTPLPSIFHSICRKIKATSNFYLVKAAANSSLHTCAATRKPAATSPSPQTTASRPKSP
jgi:hypothetical protein